MKPEQTGLILLGYQNDYFSPSGILSDECFSKHSSSVMAFCFYICANDYNSDLPYFQQRSQLDSDQALEAYVLIAPDLQFWIEMHPSKRDRQIELFSPDNPYFTIYSLLLHIQLQFGVVRFERSMIVLWILAIVLGVALIVWGAETFAEHLGTAAVRLRVSSFALALLLAGAEPEELATAVTASLRNSPAIAFGDVVGANIAICLVALGTGALIAPLPFGKRVMRYALFGLPIGLIATAFIWDGTVDRLEGGILIGLYALYVASIWWAERQPPALGETGELEEAREELEQGGARSRISKELLLVLAGIVAMILGSILLVEAVRQISQVEETQTKLALTLVGFATAFELVVLAWSTARRGATEAAIAGVVGSFTYNVTMTLGAAAIVRPLSIVNAGLLHFPLVVMMGSLVFVILLALTTGAIGRFAGGILVAAYPVFIGVLLLR